MLCVMSCGCFDLCSDSVFLFILMLKSMKMAVPSEGLRAGYGGNYRKLDPSTSCGDGLGVVPVLSSVYTVYA